MQSCNVHISWKSCSHDLLFTENLILIVRTLYFLKRRSSGLDLKTSWSFMWQGGDKTIINIAYILLEKDFHNNCFPLFLKVSVESSKFVPLYFF